MMHPLYGQKIQIRTHLKSVFVKCKTLIENMKTLPWYVLVLNVSKTMLLKVKYNVGARRRIKTAGKTERFQCSYNVTCIEWH